jgi:mannosyltransferase
VNLGVILTTVILDVEDAAQAADIILSMDPPFVASPLATVAEPGVSADSLARRQTVWRRPSPTELVIALTVIGAVLRFATLNVSSIELDESATLILVHRGLTGMLSHLAKSESAPPLYYILVWAWTKIFGAGAVGFRSFSALVGTLTIPVMYAAGRRISARVGLWAAALATVSPSMYFFSQEARCYALMVLFSAAAFVAWQRALQEPGRRRLALWAGISMLAILTHYFAAFLFIPEAIVLATRVGWRRVWAPAGAVALVGLALVPLAVSQRADNKTKWIEELSLPRRIAESLKLFTVGAYGPLVLFALVLAVLIAAAAVVLLLRRGSEPEREGAWDAAIVASVAIVLPLVLAMTHLVDVYDGRNMLAVWVPFAVLVAAGLGSARAGRGGALLGGALCAIFLAMIVAANLIPAYRRDDWRGIAHAIPRPAAPRIIVADQYAAFPLSIYMGPLRSISGRLPSIREVDFVALRHLRTVGPPQAPGVPISPPAGFRLAGITKTETFAISRFVAVTARKPTVGSLTRMSRQAQPVALNAEVILQR